jgi:hypothetical protein
MIRNLGLDPHASGVVTVDGRAYTAHTGQQRVGGGLPQAWVVHTPGPTTRPGLTVSALPS